MKSFEERFHSKYLKGRDHECWLWQGSKDNRGYGLINKMGKRIKAHRAQMELLGYDIQGLFVCHHCDTPSCVNPQHLFLGTHQDNDRDRILKGRCARGEQTGNAKLTEQEIKFIRSSTKTKVALAKEFNTTEKNIRDIIYRRSWCHV